LKYGLSAPPNPRGVDISEPLGRRLVPSRRLVPFILMTDIRIHIRHTYKAHI